MIGPTLGRYIASRFAKTVTVVFMTMFGLIYLIDFVELLRRSSDAPNVSSAFVALLTLLRTPAIVEQVLPFAVLFGAMAAFLNLTRKLELIVARAAGVSVWQFMAPPIVVAGLIGVFFTGVFNPMSAALKQRADRIETSIFGRPGQSDGDTALWIRQRSVDGQAVIRAEKSSDNGTVLGAVTAFVFEPGGAFLERVDASRARLRDGYWAMENARVTAPTVEPQVTSVYLLASNLTPEQVTKSFVSPNSVSFWKLPELVERTIAAGLDATAYRMRYQTLMASPLMLVAMVLIAASFSLRFFRFGGVARMVSGGVVAGFMLYVATKLVADLGGAGLLAASVAAWSPAIVGSLLGALALLYQEDG